MLYPFDIVVCKPKLKLILKVCMFVILCISIYACDHVHFCVCVSM